MEGKQKLFSLKYEKFKSVTGCIIPAAGFAAVAGIVFTAMVTSPTRYGIWTVVGPLGLGFCTALILISISRPFHHWMLTRELKRNGSHMQLCKWISQQPPMEFYASVDGIWLNGERYYWEGSLILKLENIKLETTGHSTTLVFNLSETHDRSSRYFDVTVTVPKGCETEANKIARKILKKNMILT